MNELEPEDDMIANIVDEFSDQLLTSTETTNNPTMVRAFLERLPPYSRLSACLHCMHQAFPSPVINGVTLALGAPLMDGADGWRIRIEILPAHVHLTHLKACRYEPQMSQAKPSAHPEQCVHAVMAAATGRSVQTIVGQLAPRKPPPSPVLTFTLAVEVVINRSSFDLERLRVSYPKFDATQYWVTTDDNPPARSLRQIRRIVSGFDSAVIQAWYCCKTCQFATLLEAVDARTINASHRDYGIVHFLAHQGTSQYLEPFVRKGLNLNNKTRHTGQTALHIAAERGHTPFVKELLRLGADASLQNRDGAFPADVASSPQLSRLLDCLDPATPSTQPALNGAPLDVHGRERFWLQPDMEIRYIACLCLAAAGDALGFHYERMHSTAEIADSVQRHGGLDHLQVAPPQFPVSCRTLLMHAALEGLTSITPRALVPDAEASYTLVDAVAKLVVERYGSGRDPSRGFTERLDCVLSLLSSGSAAWDKLPDEPNAGASHPTLLGVVVGLLFPCPAQLDALITLTHNLARITHNNATARLGCLLGAVFTSYAAQAVPLAHWGEKFVAEVLPKTQLSEAAGKLVHYVQTNGKDADLAMATPEEHTAFLASHAFRGDVNNAGSSGVDCPLVSYDALRRAPDIASLCTLVAFHPGRTSATSALAFAWWGLRNGFLGVPHPFYNAGERFTEAQHLARTVFHQAKRTLHASTAANLAWWTKLFEAPAAETPR